MGRASLKDAAENRQRVVAAASSMLRRKGIEGVGIDDLMAEAGLTRGGFYKMFGSKEGLAAEGCNHAFDGAQRNLEAAAEGDPRARLSRLVEFYFAPKRPGGECPMATLATDAARAPANGPVRQVFTDRLRKMVDVVCGQPHRDKELISMAAMVGALVLKRASDDADFANDMQSAILRFVADKSPDMGK